MTTQAFRLHRLFTFVLFLISVLLTRVMLLRVQVMDEPNERSSHDTPTPKSGGISIVATFFIGIVAVFLFSRTIAFLKWTFFAFVISTLLIAGIALYDDVKNRPFIIKLAAQIVATAIVLGFGIIADQVSLPGIGVVHLGWVAYPVTLIWIIGLTNAFNFMDGLDGLAGGVAVIVSAFFCFITYSQGSFFVYITCYTILAGTLGFMAYNFPPARIFMGDVGSVFLGFTFAVLAIIAMRHDVSHTSLFVMPLLLFNVIYDTFFTFMRRFLAGERVLDAHRTHLYQLFQRLGYSHRTVSVFHYGVCFLQGCAAFWMITSSSERRTLIYVPFLVFQVIYTVIIIRASKARGLIGLAQRGHSQDPVAVTGPVRSPRDPGRP
jgi:UDP-GlcNAc:undecaprenyl-phosphate/decaprenyl-phosphate GlcNAc-1-phosphate transferase